MTVPLIPENAPFSPAQRAWLNGFFAALLSGEAPALQPLAAAPAPPEEDFPWHDPTLSLAERLQLAEGRPKPRLLMAAMAQLDCGQCGYLCQTYAEALAEGRETRLTLCVPGGKETARKLKALVAELERPAVAPAAAAEARVARSPPAPIVLRQRPVLNRPGSAKETRHIVLELNGSGLGYEVGDSLGIQARNCPDLVGDSLVRLGATGDEAVRLSGTDLPLREALLAHCDIGRPSDAAIELLAGAAAASDEASALRALAAGTPGAGPEAADLLDLLQAFPSTRPPVGDLVTALDPLQPRLYSISSSPKATPGEVHLTVAAVRYELRGRHRNGIASTYLADRAAEGGEIGAFVQQSHGFRLPADDAALVMIGPGTGIAPFRAFLQERRALGARGRNWLFFGDQHQDTDFLYRDELEAFRRDGLLTRLDAVFSRDQAEKRYVQHRMREQGAELWRWLQEGAAVYVCGDAKRMARDVDQALAAIAAEQGGMDAGAAKAWLADLARNGRYRRDVY